MKTRTFIAILWGIAAVSFIGCSTPRKLAGSTKETAKTEEKRNETTAAEFRRTVDNTKTEGVEVPYTKIEFFPPKPDTRQAKPDTMQAGGPSNPVADTPKNRPKEPKEKAIKVRVAKPKTEKARKLNDLIAKINFTL